VWRGVSLGAGDFPCRAEPETELRHSADNSLFFCAVRSKPFFPCVLILFLTFLLLLYLYRRVRVASAGPTPEPGPFPALMPRPFRDPSLWKE